MEIKKIKYPCGLCIEGNDIPVFHLGKFTLCPIHKETCPIGDYRFNSYRLGNSFEKTKRYGNRKYSKRNKR